MNRSANYYNANRYIIINVACLILSYILTIIHIPERLAFAGSLIALLLVLMQGIALILLGLNMKKSILNSIHIQPDNSIYVLLPTLGICYISYIIIGYIALLIRIGVMVLLFIQVGKLLKREINNNVSIEAE